MASSFGMPASTAVRKRRQVAIPFVLGSALPLFFLSGPFAPPVYPILTPALAVAQSLVALLIAEAPEEGLAQLKATEEQLDSFSVYHL